jgi:hypothetical protein
MAPTELPIACSLDGRDLEARYEELAGLGRRSLISVENRECGDALLRFTRDEPTRDALRRAIAAESECCPFLDLRLSEGDPLELTIDGPADAAPVIADLVGAISGAPTP